MRDNMTERVRERVCPDMTTELDLDIVKRLMRVQRNDEKIKTLADGLCMVQIMKSKHVVLLSLTVISSRWRRLSRRPE